MRNWILLYKVLEVARAFDLSARSGRVIDWAELLLIGSKGRGSSLDVWAGELQAVSSAGVIALLPLFCRIGTENAPFAIEEDCLGENCSVDFLR